MSIKSRWNKRERERVREWEKREIEKEKREIEKEKVKK